VEGEVGRQGMYRLYVLSGVAGALVWMVLAAITGATAVVVGASGAVYGIMVYAAFMAPRMRVILIVFPIEMRWLVGVLLFLGLYATTLQVRGEMLGGTAHAAHLGGAAWGFVAFRFLRSWHVASGYRTGGGFGSAGRWLRRVRAERHQKAEADRQALLDRLLDKVHTHGMGALTAAERRFLERTSQHMKKR